MKLGAPKAVFAALLSSAALAIVLAAQTSLTCTDKVALPMPGDMMGAMPGMDMSGMQAPAGQAALMICPVVLALIVASAAFALAAVVMLCCDPHRALTQRTIVLALCRLSPLRTLSVLALAGGGAVGAMLWLEHAGLPALPACAMLAAVLCACSLLATFAAIAAGRIALAFGRRLILAIVCAIARSNAAAAPRVRYLAALVPDGHAVPLLAAGRGLRAPPAFVR